MEITSIKNAVYLNTGQTAINCDVLVGGNWLPFTAAQGDTEQHGRDVYNMLVESGDVADYVEPDLVVVLDEQKEARRQQLKQEREEIAKSPINNVQVGRTEDRERIQGAIDNWVLLTLVNGKKPWVMADNTIALLSKAELEHLIPVYVQREDQCFVAYGEALSQLTAATTLEEVAAVGLPYAE